MGDTLVSLFPRPHLCSPCVNPIPDALTLHTPIAFFIFNRPTTTQQVFQAIRQAKPPKLLIVADGPRPDRPTDAENCALARSILDQIDWDCEVLTHFSDINLGCRKRISSGLDWVFEQVEEAIILEDDCLPDPSFFPYCQELLERYRNIPEVMMISGNNFQFGHNPIQESYYFSHYGHVWGWATWRRAWQKYDDVMGQWPPLRDTNWLQQRLGNIQAAAYWSHIFEGVYNGSIPLSRKQAESESEGL
ncbi:MAG: hypothetical protein ACO35D_06080, partial [Aquiluna sp.]